MKLHKVIVAAVLSVTLLGGAAETAQAQDNQPRRGWSKKGKGAAVGAGAGAVTGAVVAGKGDRATGALIGGAAGAVGGALIGRKKDKKRDPQRYEQYTRKD
ncbi:glycine zipper 2TM domain-containing protein [Hymenobacter oligotrophus]|uniref:Glycine zipper 2TM domain-containing protein n=1 Tax=Hymenobacter oligotrophus TaxID=2319843 RepID=A0A3B7R5J8_9BACT|nr:glycine zipper domain-containing protein [Hymenobacter oligotrophus]AYA38630.1 glycine zipper 2TM domain-containing protein [Hymenobacter oligotrophus]